MIDPKLKQKIADFRGRLVISHSLSDNDEFLSMITEYEEICAAYEEAINELTKEKELLREENNELKMEIDFGREYW